MTTVVCLTLVFSQRCFSASVLFPSLIDHEFKQQSSAAAKQDFYKNSLVFPNFHFKACSSNGQRQKTAGHFTDPVLAAPGVHLH